MLAMPAWELRHSEARMAAKVRGSAWPLARCLVLAEGVVVGFGVSAGFDVAVGVGAFELSTGSAVRARFRFTSLLFTSLLTARVWLAPFRGPSVFRPWSVFFLS